MHRPWTDLELAALRRLYPSTDTREVAHFIGRSEHAVKMMAIKLGVRKSEEAMRQIHARTRFGGERRYPDGRRTWNKGLRFQAGGRSVETRFKPGSCNGRAAELVMPIGSERWIDGYLWRKVAQRPGASMRGNWRQVHHLLWEQAGRTIPRGYALSFRNGNRSDIRLDNLELVSRVDLMRRNSRQNLPPEVNELLTLRAALRRRIRNLEKNP